MGIFEALYLLIYIGLFLFLAVKFLNTFDHMDFIKIIIVVAVFILTIYLCQTKLDLSISSGIVENVLSAVSNMNFYSYIILISNVVLVGYFIKEANNNY